MRHATSLLLASLLLAGCQAAVDPDDLDPVADAQGFCASYFDLLLSKLADCGVQGEALARASYPAYAAACATFGHAQDAGRISFDRARAERCLSAIRDASCTDAGDVGESGACESPFEGRVPAGGACTEDLECVDGTRGCEREDGACAGTCLAFGAEGARCGGSWECRADLYCSANEVCARRIPAGQTCAGLEGPFGDPCAAGSRCDLLPGGVATCRPFAKAGEPCGALVNACDPDAGLFCGPSGRCVATPVAEGGDCEWSWQCGSGLFCDRDATAAFGRCEERRTSGSCASSDECLFPADCREGSCELPARVGESCTAGENACVLGAFCPAARAGDSGACADWPRQGGACGVLAGELVGCLDGWCDASDGGEGTCRAFKPAGAECASDRECGAGELGGWCGQAGTCEAPGVCQE